MTANVPSWRKKVYDDGQEVLLKTVRFTSLLQSFECAYKITDALAGTEAEKDFTVSADPTALFIVLHAYSRGEMPRSYDKIAKRIDSLMNC